MKSEKLNYSALIDTISKVHKQAQSGAAGTVNRFLILRNWLIGAYIIEYEQKGKDRAEYGESLLSRLSVDLQKRNIAGCSRQMLQRMRLFYQMYPQIAEQICSPAVNLFVLPKNINMFSKCPPAVSKLDTGKLKLPKPLAVKFLINLSWTHFVELISIDDPWKRAFYENECLKGNWSKRQLQRQIGSLLYERTGLSTDKKAVIEAGRKQAIEMPQTIADIIRDPYVLEFTGLAEKSQYHESTLEDALLNHLQSFLLELGNGFCFEARQKRITVGNENDYIDLVFYHRILRCHLLIDLKIRRFQHGDAGQMNFYLNYWKDQMMTEGDNPPIGLILCTDKDQTKVEYAVGGLDHQLFVSRYMVVLPKPEEIQHLIENDRAYWEQNQPIPKPQTDKEVRR
ncbi:MAG: PDDEXK nuclease domain-containing protein [Candidatus Firestonebacteria bacterium]